MGGEKIYLNVINWSAIDRKICMRRNLLLMAVVVMVLSGCGYDWVNRSKPGSNYAQDQANCRLQAINAFPDIVIQQQPQSSLIYETSCSKLGGTMECESRPRRTSESVVTLQQQQNIQTNSNRSSYVSSCMTALGWRLEKVQ